MKLPLAAIAVALSIAPLYAQTSGPSGIHGVGSDEFSPYMKINGAIETGNPVGGIRKLWRLRSFVSKASGATTHQLVVSVYYASSLRKKHFDEASDETATPLTVKPIWGEPEIGCSGKLFAYGCSYSEEIGIDVTIDALRAHATTGYRIKITAKSGDSFILAISQSQIAVQLEAMERCIAYLRKHGTAVSNQAGLQPSRNQLGFKASEITDEIAAKTGLQKGPGIVVFEVTAGSLAERSGLKVLDRILSVEGCGQSIDSKDAMKKCLTGKKAYIEMAIDRGGDVTHVGVKLDAQNRSSP